MKRNFLLLALALISVLSMAAADEIKRYEVNVGDFTSLRIINDINVEYVCNADSAGKAVYYTTANKASTFMFDNNSKGKVSIQLTTDESLAPKGLPTIRIYSRFLQEAQNDGDSILRIVSVAPAPKLKFKLSANGKVVAHNISGTTIEAAIFTGNGTIEISGKCDEADLRCTGTGQILGEDLIADKVNCKLLGTGSIRCHVNNGPLSIKGSGSGKVYYRGTPTEVKTLQLGSIKAVALGE